VGLALVRGDDHPVERGEALLDQATLGGFWILVEGKANVVVSGVKNAKPHEDGDVTGLALLKNLMEILQGYELKCREERNYFRRRNLGNDS